MQAGMQARCNKQCHEGDMDITAQPYLNIRVVFERITPAICGNEVEA
jgi:hypothetical protein